MSAAFHKGLVLALEYRWKGMAEAAAYAMRGRGLFDVLRRALHVMYSHEDIEKAQRAADEAIEVEDLAFQTRAAVRAGGVLRAMDSDKHNLYLVEWHIAAVPLQKYLNKVMEADKAVTELERAATYGGDHALTERLFDRALRLNMKFMDGSNAADVLRSYPQLLCDLSGDDWQCLSKFPQRKLKLCLLLTRAQGDASRRLLAYFEDSRFQDTACDQWLRHRLGKGRGFCVAHAWPSRCLPHVLGPARGGLLGPRKQRLESSRGGRVYNVGFLARRLCLRRARAFARARAPQRSASWFGMRRKGLGGENLCEVGCYRGAGSRIHGGGQSVGAAWPRQTAMGAALYTLHDRESAQQDAQGWHRRAACAKDCRARCQDIVEKKTSTAGAGHGTRGGSFARKRGLCVG